MSPILSPLPHESRYYFGCPHLPWPYWFDLRSLLADSLATHDPGISVGCRRRFVRVRAQAVPSVFPLHFQGVHGFGSLAAGALLILPILCNTFTFLVGGKIMDKRGPWLLLFVGFAIIAVGEIAICFSASQVSLIGVLMASVVVYSGVGLVLSPSQNRTCDADRGASPASTPPSNSPPPSTRRC